MREDPITQTGQVLQGMMEMEKTLRLKAEERLRAQVKLLIQTASAFAGLDFEKIRKNDPQAVNYWTPQQWQTFFLDFVLPKNQSFAWGDEAGAKVDFAALKKLEQENNGLCQQLDQAQADIEKKSFEIEKLHAQINALQSAFQTLGEMMVASRSLAKENGADRSLDDEEVKPVLPPLSAQGAVNLLSEKLFWTIKPRRVSEDGILPIGYAQILDDLSSWKPVKRPARFPKLLESAVSEERWQRQSMALYILAKYGLGVRMELDWLISHAAGTKVNSGAQRITIDMLADFGLVVRRRLYEATPPLGSQLIVYCLSTDGRQLCDLFGWEKVESDWERILRLHCLGDTEQEKIQEAHTLNILSLIRNARYRGYKAMVLPVVSGQSFPDAYVELGEECSYVEVERSTKELSTKWHHQVELQGQVALCAVDQKSRARLVSDCKLDRNVRHGRATDMRTLMELASMYKDKVGNTPLWAEVW
jgi:hypothetical protein